MKKLTINRGFKDAFFLTLCIIGALAILSSTMSKNPVLNPFAESLGTPEALMGVIAAASTVPGILMSLPAGSLSDSFGRKKVLVLAGVVFASAPLLYVFIDVWWHLILVRFYHGFATAIFVPVARATIAEHYPDQKGERISVFTSATIVGRGIAPFLGGFILSTTMWNYRFLYIAVGVAGVTAFITTLLILKENRGAKRGIAQSDRPRATKGRSYRSRYTIRLWSPRVLFNWVFKERRTARSISHWNHYGGSVRLDSDRRPLYGPTIR